MIRNHRNLNNSFHLIFDVYFEITDRHLNFIIMVISCENRIHVKNHQNMHKTRSSTDYEHCFKILHLIRILMEFLLHKLIILFIQERHLYSVFLESSPNRGNK